MQLRIADILYFVTLCVTSFAAFGPLGFFVAMFVEFVWLVIFRKIKLSLVEVLVVVAIVGMLVGLLIPAAQASRELARVAHCRHNLENVAIALLDNATRKGALPQAMKRGKDNLPFQSWRISILPGLDQLQLYDAYDQSQPWNSAANSAALAQPMDLFGCPSDPPINLNAPHTNYFAIVGPHTAWPEDRGLALSEITDGRDTTILLLEVAFWDVPWGEPRDLTYDEAFNLLIGNPRPSNRFPQDASPVIHFHSGNHGYFYQQSESASGVHAAFADGSVRFLKLPLSEEMAKALLSANAGDHVDRDEFERPTTLELDYEKVYATIAFAAVALWPINRAFRKRPKLAPGQ